MFPMFQAVKTHTALLWGEKEFSTQPQAQITDLYTASVILHISNSLLESFKHTASLNVSSGHQSAGQAGSVPR